MLLIAGVLWTQNSYAMQGVLIVLLIGLTTTIALNTIAFDCEHPDHEISLIAANDVESCKRDETETKIRETEIQVIQEKLFEKILIQHCLIKRVSIIMYCGAFSHTSIVRHGLTRDVVELSNEACRELHKLGTYMYAGTIIKDIAGNSTRNIDIVEYGTVDNEGNCNGVSISTKRGNYDNVIMHTSLEISIVDYSSV